MIKAAIVGMGYWGRMVAASLGGSAKIRVTRAADTDPAAAREFCAAQGIALSGAFRDLLADDGIDAVILCTPHPLHEDQIIQAAEAGKHVFCEKPLALTKASAARSVAACRAAGVVLGVGHERRYEKPMEEIKRLLDANILGRHLHIEANFSHDKFVGRSPDHWRFDAAETAGPGMTGMGIHLTDAFIGFFGPIAEVRTLTADRTQSVPVGDVVAVQVRFASGATGFLAALSATPYYGRFTVFGSAGWAEVRDDFHPELGHPTHLFVGAADGGRTSHDYPSFDVVRAGFEGFADAALGRAAYRFSDQEKIHNVAVLEAIFASAVSGSPVAVG